jgi:tight adherence protein C
MHEPMALAFVGLWAGLTLLLLQVRALTRPTLAQRLHPYRHGTSAPPRPPLDVSSWRDLVGPVCRSLGEGAARLVGVTEDVGARLQRIGAPVDATAFRVRQVGWATIALFASAAVSMVGRLPAAVAILLLFGAPALAFLVIEQRLSSASAAWQRRVFLELPVITEQVAMLLTAGYSLGAALNRVAERGNGLCAADLRRVCRRVQQGLSEVDALREWAARARVPALDRLVPVLALNEDAADLGRLISDESRSIRADVHRELVQTMEKRGQQVWIPVTVATLVPGVIFLAVPFIEALRVFSGS